MTPDPAVEQAISALDRFERVSADAIQCLAGESGVLH